MYRLTGSGKKKQWTIFRDNGPYFPPEYESHNIPVINPPIWAELFTNGINHPKIKVLAIPTIVSINPSLLLLRAWVALIPKPRPTTADFKDQFIALLLWAG